MLETIHEWKKLYQARKWMKQNATFLPAWHAYVGYTAELFECFAEGNTVEEAATQCNLDKGLLQNWVDVGLAVGHLRERDNRIHATPAMLSYVSPSSPDSVGPLLQELMELHIPTLLQYPSLLKGEEKPVFENDRFGPTVAATSALLEKLAFPKLVHWIKAHDVHSVLDIGCGHGGYLRRLSEVRGDMRLIGIEQNEEVVRQAQEESNSSGCKLELVHDDFNRWGGPEEPVDLIMMNNILHYFEPDKRCQLLRKAKQMISLGGTITLISPVNKTGSGQAFASAFNSFMSAHENLYPFPTKEELEQMAGGEGLRMSLCQPVIREGSWYFIGLEQTGEER
ncbi:class I SAM-dependent methyltransferase [Paenibacillus sambharensis]|uniref:class I SAM-dependent methyltransferase n=1 Tax=Paenibacillus sambharensis TaxID=1803190 RepID=UPI001FE73F3E|nr:class I SAM-dependent methyltransferase [Paenibacillus sambharensis]